jgi:hypothetical protein
MFILWLVTGVSLTTSLVALVGVRRARKRLETLSQSYWELRYQQGELRAQLKASATPGAPADVPAAPMRVAADSFVPLSAVKR